MVEALVVVPAAVVVSRRPVGLAATVSLRLAEDVAPDFFGSGVAHPVSPDCSALFYLLPAGITCS